MSELESNTGAAANDLNKTVDDGTSQHLTKMDSNPVESTSASNRLESSAPATKDQKSSE